MCSKLSFTRSSFKRAIVLFKLCIIINIIRLLYVNTIQPYTLLKKLYKNMPHVYSFMPYQFMYFTCHLGIIKVNNKNMVHCCST